jgi:hypothetical protein
MRSASPSRRSSISPIAPPRSLRWLTSCKHPSGIFLPAVLARVSNVDDELVAVHRTYLLASGEGKAAANRSCRASPFLSLEVNIDVKKLVDEQWLRDPENRKIAALWLKLATLQKDWALGILGTQIRVDEKQLDSEEG